MRGMRAALASAVVMLVTIAVVGGGSGRADAAIFHGARFPEPPPQLSVKTVMSGLTNAWDVAFTADGVMFVTERPGGIHVRFPDGTSRQLVADLSDLWVAVESGVEGIEVDPDFASNRRIYTCQGTTDNVDAIVDGTSTHVIAWTVDDEFTTLTRVNDPLVGGMDGLDTHGFHTGCQLRVDRDGLLRIGTGDGGTPTNAQNKFALAGKTLRVDRFSGAGVVGNPFFGEPSEGDARIYSYGHRNVQGLAIHPRTGAVWSVEHGTIEDDEVNILQAGGNYGWDPGPGYNEDVPMTDVYKFRTAIRAVWNSGRPTIATSGATFLTGTHWGPWQGALAVSTLRGTSLRILSFDTSGRFVEMFTPPELSATFGRLRAAEMGPCGVLYITTDIGAGKSRVLAVEPTVDNHGPAVVTTAAGQSELARCGPAGDVELRTVDESGEGEWRSVGGRALSEPDVASRGPGLVDAFVIGSDGHMYHQPVVNGVGGGWESIGGSFTSAPSAVAVDASRVDVFGRGLDGQVWTARMSGSSWTPWRPLGGTIRFGPEVSRRNTSTFDVFAIGADSALWHQTLTNGQASGWSRLGGVFTSAPASISWSSNRIDVFARGADGALWSVFWDGTRWSSFYSLGGLLASAPAATSDAVNRFDVYVEGVDGAIWRKSWTGSGFTSFAPID